MCYRIQSLNIVLYWFLRYLKVSKGCRLPERLKTGRSQTCIFLFLFSNDKFFTKTDNLTPWWVWTPSGCLLSSISHLNLPFCFLNPFAWRFQDISLIFVSEYPLKLHCSSSWAPAWDIWPYSVIYLRHLVTWHGLSYSSKTHEVFGHWMYLTDRPDLNSRQNNVISTQWHLLQLY